MAEDRSITDVIAEIGRLGRLLEDEDMPVSEPGAPAPEAAIEAVEAARGLRLPPAYRAFLARHDGWERFAWSLSLVSTAVLGGDAYSRGFLDYAEEVPDELDQALVIGTSGGDYALILLLPDGTVVDWRYDERARYADFDAFLADCRKLLHERYEDRRATCAAVEAEWTSEVRTAREQALADELRGALAGAPPPDWPAAPSAVEPATSGPTDPRELVVRAGGAIAAEVTLTLVLYLGASPSPDEIARAYGAFRARFPVAGTLGWAPAGTYCFGLAESDTDPDDHGFVTKLRIDDDGHFGLRAVVTPSTAGRDYVFNLRRVPPTDSDSPAERAGFCEVILPAGESAEAVFGLAGDLLAILPVRSGHAGYCAQTYDDYYDNAEVFAWCRRLLCLDVGGVDGWLETTRWRLRGASWLTLLGPTFASALGDRLRFAAADDVEVTRSPHGVLLRAGPAPTLSNAGLAPIRAVAHALAPLTVAAYRELGTLYVAGNRFQTLREEMAPFLSHRATSAFIRRFLDPDGWLGPTPLERGEALLAAVCANGGEQWWQRWQAEPKSSWRRFDTLLTLLFNASCADLTADASVAALELAIEHDGEPIDRVVNNLLIAYHLRGQADRAAALLPRALGYADRNPSILHSAADVYARAGDLPRALELALRARDAGYPELATMQDDADLAPLRDLDAFQALFR